MKLSEEAMWKMARKMGMPESAIQAVKAKRAAALARGEDPGALKMPGMDTVLAKPGETRTENGKSAAGMDGRELLGRLVRLSQVETVKDIPQLTHALFPGTHCPLMGAAMAAGGIKDALLVIVGTDECSFYTKSMTINERFGGIAGRCVSVILDDHDVTFGSIPMLQKVFGDIVEEYRPQCVILVTTCVIEVIGDDYDAVAQELEQMYRIPVLPVHTEHFKCEDHFPGLERTITACLSLMEERPCNGGVNVLGQRMGDFASTELHGVLERAGVKLGMQLPSGCSVAEIQNGAAARANIVVHDIALPLAKAMKEKFNIPYVYFDKFACPENILQAYEMLFSYLQLAVPEEVREAFRASKALEERLKPELEGIPYIYGNTPCECFELNAYLCRLGMVPQLIQSNKFREGNKADVGTVLKSADPYICKAANIAPLQYIYDELHPWVYLGHEFGDRLRRKGVALFHADRMGAMLGFEIADFVLETMARTVAEARIYRKEAGL